MEIGPGATGGLVLHEDGESENGVEERLLSDVLEVLVDFSLNSVLLDVLLLVLPVAPYREDATTERSYVVLPNLGVPGQVVQVVVGGDDHRALVGEGDGSHVLHFDYLRILVVEQVLVVGGPEQVLKLNVLKDDELSIVEAGGVVGSTELPSVNFEYLLQYVHQLALASTTVTIE